MKLIDLAAIEHEEKSASDIINAVCDELGFDYASYATMNPIKGDVQGYANYPDEWKIHYGSHGYHHFDPTIYQSVLSIAPVDWGRFNHDEKFHAVFRDANDFGITSRGLTVPIRGPYGECGMLSVTRDCSDAEWEKLKKHVMGDLQTRRALIQGMGAEGHYQKIMAKVPLAELYQGHQQSFEFQRTFSRLQEMQSVEYLSAAHRA